MAACQKRTAAVRIEGVNNRTPRRFFPLIVLALVTIACFGCASGLAYPPHASAAEHEKAPDFSLKDLEGRTVSLSSLKGKVVLLNFWATWCPSCVAEMPSLNKLYHSMKSRGLEVIGVSTDGSPAEVREYVQKKGLAFRVVVDESRDVSRKYRVFSLPTTFLVDKKGDISEKFFGDYEWNNPEMKAKIEKLL